MTLDASRSVIASMVHSKIASVMENGYAVDGRSDNFVHGEKDESFDYSVEYPFDYSFDCCVGVGEIFMQPQLQPAACRTR